MRGVSRQTAEAVSCPTKRRSPIEMLKGRDAWFFTTGKDV